VFLDLFAYLLTYILQTEGTVMSEHQPKTGFYLTAVVGTAFILARQRQVTQVIETHARII